MMIKKSLRLFTLLIFAGFLAKAQSPVEKALDSVMKEFNMVGLSVVVYKDNKQVYAQNLGYKNPETKTPLSENDIFRIASISKSFTSTALLQLVEKKKISLDDDVSDLIGFTVRNPNFPDKKITLEMLLSHRSSISDRQGYFNLDVINPEKSADAGKCYNDYEPGSKYQYCNLNFNMAGAILERLTGVRFHEYIQQQILKPLGLYGGYWVGGLDSSRFVPLYEYNSEKGAFEVSPAAYHPRTEELKSYVMGYSTPVFSPTGGMKISALHLARYMAMHMNYGKYDGVRILKKKTSQRMQTPLGTDGGYGLALSESTTMLPGHTLVGHTGSAYGLYSAMFFDPKKKFGFVVVTNGGRASYRQDTNQLLAATIQTLHKYIIE